MKVFEEAIASGSRLVDVRYRPRTGVIESLAAAETERVDVQPAPDDTAAMTFAGFVFAP